MTSVQTFYLRDVPADVGGGTLPSGLLSTWEASTGAQFGASARSLRDSSGAATSTYSETAGSIGLSDPCDQAALQAISAPLAAQSIGAGDWTVAFSARWAASGSGYGWRGRAALHLVNGSTGAIRTTIFALQTIGGDKTNITAYRTAYSTTVAGSAATVTAGDYLALEIGVQTYTTVGSGFPDIDVRVGNTTAISSDNASNSTPQSFISAPAALDVAGPGTTLYLDSAASDINPGAELEKELAFARGAASVDYVTNTTASGTSIQATDSAGGTVLTWLSPPLDAVTIAGSIRVNVRGRESANAANAGRRIKIERTDGAGAVQSTIVALTNHGTEFTTTDAANSVWNITPTSTALSSGDRIKVTLYLGNVGTMGGSQTVTYSVAGPTEEAAGDTWLRFIEALVEQVTASATDTATATEGTPSLVGSYSQAESATATEGTPALTGAYGETDGATATEGTPTLTGAYAEMDAATATEGDPAIAADLAAAETVAATEGTPVLIGDYAETDTVSATEGVPTLTAGYAATDTGTATEGASVLIVLPPSVEDVGGVTLLRLDRPSATLAALAGPVATLAALAAPTAGLIAAVPGPVATLAAMAGPTAGLIVAVPGPVATLSG